MKGESILGYVIIVYAVLKSATYGNRILIQRLKV